MRFFFVVIILRKVDKILEKSRKMTLMLFQMTEGVYNKTDRADRTVKFWPHSVAVSYQF